MLAYVLAAFVILIAPPPAAPLSDTPQAAQIDLAPKLTGPARTYTYTRDVTQKVYGKDDAKPNTQRHMVMSVDLRLEFIDAAEGLATMKVTYEAARAEVDLPAGPVQLDSAKTYPAGSVEDAMAGHLRQMTGKSVTVRTDALGLITDVSVPAEDARRLASNQLVGRFFNKGALAIVLQPLLGLKTSDSARAAMDQPWTVKLPLPDAGQLSAVSVNQHRRVTAANDSTATIAIESLDDLSEGLDRKLMPDGKVSVQTSGNATWDLARGALIDFELTESLELRFNYGGDAAKPVRNQTISIHRYERRPDEPRRE